MTGGPQEDHTTLREAAQRLGVVSENIPKDVLQISQQTVVCADYQHTVLAAGRREIGTEIVVGQDDTDRLLGLAQDGVLARAGHSHHALGVEGHGDVELVL